MQAGAVSLVVLAVFSGLSRAALPLGWKACKMSSKDFNDCLQKEVDKAIKTLANGDKKLGFQPLEPLTLERVVLNQAGTGAVGLNLTVKNMNYHGLTKGKFTKFNLNGKWKNVVSTIHFDKVVTDGDYEAEGKILSLPVRGKGKMTVTWLDFDANGLMDLKIIEKNGKKHLSVETFKVDLQPKKIIYNFQNILGQNSEVSKNINTVLNENWADVWKELKAPIDDMLGRTFAMVTNNIWGKIPAEEIIVN